MSTWSNPQFSPEDQLARGQMRIRDPGGKKTLSRPLSLAPIANYRANAIKKPAQAGEDLFEDPVPQFLDSAAAPEIRPPSSTIDSGSGVARKSLRNGVAIGFAVTLSLAALASAVANRGSGVSRVDAVSLPPRPAMAKFESAERPKLGLLIPTAHHKGEAAPLGVSVADNYASVVVVVRGLPEGTTLSVGSEIAAGIWWLSIANLASAAIRPPPDFLGAMDASIELRLADGSLSDQRMQHFEWIEETAPAAMSKALETEHEYAALKRGDELIQSGDVAAARLVLKRAADLGSARAAFLLGRTYDAALLNKMRVRGVAPDAAMSRYWYDKAEEFGSKASEGGAKMLAVKPE